MLQVLLTPLPSAIKVPLYRLLGARIGDGATIAAFTVLVADEIDLAPDSYVRSLSLIGPLTSLKMGVGAGIGSFCLIHGFLNGAALTLGARSYIVSTNVIDVSADVTLGEYAALAPRVVIMTHAVHEPAPWGYKPRVQPVIIGDLASIGFGTKIGPGVSIASRAKIIPNSTILQDIGEAGLIFDSPLRRLEFPLSLVQQDMGDETLTSLMREAAIAYLQSIKGSSETIDEGAGWVALKSGRSPLVIAIGDDIPDDAPAGKKWLFGFDLPESVMTGAEGCKAIDFRHILHSSNTDRRLMRLCTFLRLNYGMRMVNYKYRDLLTIKPE